MKLIIFDIDGTLTDTKNVDDKCFIEAFKIVFGIDIKNQNWNELKNVTDWGITEEIITKKLNRLPSELEYERMLNEFVRLLELETKNDASQFNEVKKANEFLRHIQSNPKYKVGIATGAWGKSARLKLEMIGIKTKGIAFSNSTKFKSRERIMNDVIHQLKKTNKIIDKIIYFGDGEWDYKTCEKLGISFIGIDINNDGKLKRLGAKNVFQNFEQIDTILETIEQFN